MTPAGNERIFPIREEWAERNFLKISVIWYDLRAGGMYFQRPERDGMKIVWLVCKQDSLVL